MNLHESWKSLANLAQQQNNSQFWSEYYDTEKGIYQQILLSGKNKFTGTVQQLAELYEVEPTIFCGFIDGANTSLTEQIALDDLTEESEVALEFDFEKLYYNMLEARAKWLYGLDEWEDVLPAEKRNQILKQWRGDNIAHSTKVGRNDPCPCGSGKKYKNCCEE